MLLICLNLNFQKVQTNMHWSIINGVSAKQSVGRFAHPEGKVKCRQTFLSVSLSSSMPYWSFGISYTIQCSQLVAVVMSLPMPVSGTGAM